MRQDPALTVTFQLHPKHGEAIAPKLLAWTTTPWTLPSNLALAVHPTPTTRCMEKGGERWILAEASREHYAKELDGFAQVGSLKGSELIGRTYEPLFPFFADDGECLRRPRRRVHRARRGHRRRPHRAGLRRGRHGGRPGARAAGGRSGRLRGQLHRRRCRPSQGKNVFEANKDIIRDLKAARRGRPPRDLRPQLSALLADRPAADLQGDPVLVREGHRLPRPHGRAQPGHHLGAGARQDGIFGNWLANARDWNIGRNRYLGRADPGVEVGQSGISAHRRLRLARRDRARFRRAPEGPAPALRRRAGRGPTRTIRPASR